MDWFLYDRDLRHKRVKGKFPEISMTEKYLVKFLFYQEGQ